MQIEYPPRPPLKLWLIADGFTRFGPVMVVDKADAQDVCLQFLRAYPEWKTGTYWPTNLTILRDGSGFLFNVTRK